MRKLTAEQCAMMRISTNSLISRAFAHRLTPLVAHGLYIAFTVAVARIVTRIGKYEQKLINGARDNLSIDTYWVMTTNAIWFIILYDIVIAFAQSGLDSFSNSYANIDGAVCSQSIQPFWKRVYSDCGYYSFAYISKQKYMMIDYAITLIAQISALPVRYTVIVMASQALLTGLSVMCYVVTQTWWNKCHNERCDTNTIMTTRVKRRDRIEDIRSQYVPASVLSEAKIHIATFINSEIALYLNRITLKLLSFYAMSRALHMSRDIATYDETARMVITISIMQSHMSTFVRSAIMSACESQSNSDALKLLKHKNRGVVREIAQPFTRVTIDELHYHIETVDSPTSKRAFDLKVARDAAIDARIGRASVMSDASGSGKTTLAGFLSNDVDHDSIREFALSFWNGDEHVQTLRGADAVMTASSMCAYLAQAQSSPPSYKQTLRMLFAGLGQDDESIIATLHEFGLEQFTSLDQEIGGESVVSPGQWSRIEIARILLGARKSRIIVLDELDRNIDAESIARIVGFLRKFIVDHIVVIITHNPVTRELLADQSHIKIEMDGAFSHARTID